LVGKNLKNISSLLTSKKKVAKILFLKKRNGKVPGSIKEFKRKDSKDLTKVV